MLKTLKTGLACAGLAVAATGLWTLPAQAGTLYNNWNYAIDSFDDGYAAGIIGPSSDFEFYGLAIKETADTVYVGINSNLARNGVDVGAAADGHIGYGDLFFNFTGQNLDTAQNPTYNSNLFAIRFADNSDSGVTELGVYSNVIAQNVAKANSGFRDTRHHRNRVKNQVSGTATYGDLAWNDAYFGDGVDVDWTLGNSIQSGTRVGDINLLDSAALTAAGLDFQAVNAGVAGNHTFGFSFARSLFPEDGGDFVAHLLAECINDGFALKGTSASIETLREQEGPEADVPEPALMTGLLAVGMMGLLKRRAPQSAQTA